MARRIILSNARVDGTTIHLGQALTPTSSLIDGVHGLTQDQSQKTINHESGGVRGDDGGLLELYRNCHCRCQCNLAGLGGRSQPR